MGKAGENVGDTPAAPEPALRLRPGPRSIDPARMPISVRTIRRVYHVTDTTVAAADRDDTRQLAEYSDGFGRKIQVRTEAADFTVGDAASGDSGLPSTPPATPTPSGTSAIPATPPNVAVTGWVIYDNKNHVVRSYEPFYSTGLGYAIPAGAPARPAPGPVLRPARAQRPNRQPRRLADLHRLRRPRHHRRTRPHQACPVRADSLGDLHLRPQRQCRPHRPRPVPGLPVALEHSRQYRDRRTRRVVTTAVARNGADPATDWFATQTSYDIRGNILTVTDALGRVTYQRRL